MHVNIIKIVITMTTGVSFSIIYWKSVESCCYEKWNIKVIILICTRAVHRRPTHPRLLSIRTRSALKTSRRVVLT